MVRIAKKLACRSDHEHYRHGALVLKGGNIIARGYNKGVKHAEVAALEKLDPEARKGCTVISIRVTKGGKLAMAKPCCKCEAYMREHGVHAVEWSDEYENMHKERLS
jgi:deoxycytidylate deaminase